MRDYLSFCELFTVQWPEGHWPCFTCVCRQLIELISELYRNSNLMDFIQLNVFCLSLSLCVADAG